jgi:uncharacterized protein YjdB
MTPENTTQFWATQNGCSPTPVIDTMPNLAADGLTFIRYTYNNNTTNKKAILYKVVNGTHSWYYRPTNDIDYCQTIWAFFRQYAKAASTTPTPTASFTASDTTVCIGNTVTFTSTSTSSSGSLDSIRWTISGGTPSTGTTAAITSTFNTVGNYTITLKAYKSGNVSTATKSIRVKALPTVNALTGTLTVCVGSTTTLSSTTPGGTWLSSNTSVATVLNGVVTGVSAGTANIYYSVTTSGCTKAVAATVTVTALPTVSPITGTTSVCVGSTTSLSNPSSGGTWSSSNTGIATVLNGVVTGVAAGTVTINYAVTTNGCTKTVSATVTVKALPTVNAITGTLSVCVGSTTTLNSTTLGGTWSSSNTSVATVLNGVVTGVSAGTANIYYSVTTNGCTKAVAATVTVNALPTVSPITGTTSVCVGSTTSLSNPSSAGTWSSSNTSVATVLNGVVTGVSAGTATIFYAITTNGCTKTVSVTVTVNPLPTVNAITGTLSVCVGSTTTLNSTTPGGTWSSSNTSVATVLNGVITGVSAGTANIYYSVTTNGCTKAVAATVTVNALPTVNAITGTTSVCAGSSTTLSSTTAGGTWSSSNTSVATVLNGVVTGVSAGTANIYYSVTANGCTKAVAATVTVKAKPNITVNSPTICAGQSAILSAIIDGTSCTYIWSTGQATCCISTEPMNANATRTVTGSCGGCSDTAVSTITVIPLPATPTITRRNDTVFSSVTGTQYKWYLNNVLLTTTTTSFLKVTQNGSYKVEVVNNGCTSLASNVISVTLTGVRYNKTDIAFTVFPNPNNGSFEVKINGTTTKTYQLRLYNINGQVLLSEEMNIKSGQNSKQVNVSGMEKGIYFLSIIGDEGISTQNIIIQ